MAFRLSPTSYARFVNVVNRDACGLTNTWGRLGKKDDAFAYFSPNDLRYAAFVLAGLKTGRRVSENVIPVLDFQL
jgi:hypothetical protein